MYVIGLTGNIATGKSSVSRMLKSLGACVHDADKIAHEVMRAGTNVFRGVVERFGSGVVGLGGEIDRQALGAIVFRDAEAMVELERLVHPAVVAEVLARLERCQAAVGVVEAIKLLEAGMRSYVDAVWVVSCPREQQIDRLMRDRGLPQAEAELRVDAQPPQRAKIAQADVVLRNSSTLKDLRAQVAVAWQAIPGMASASPDGCGK